MAKYDSLYNLQSLQTYVQEYINEYDTAMVLPYGKSLEGIEKEKKRKGEFSAYLEESSDGQKSDRGFIKLFIRQLITEGFQDYDIYINGYPEDYRVTKDNYRKFLDLNNIETMSVYYAFKTILYKYENQFQNLALVNLIEKYNLYRLRKDEFGEDMYFIDARDIVEIYKNERFVLDYNDTISILVQIIYENFKGLGAIDDLVYMGKMDEIEIGGSGLPNENTPVSSKLLIVDLPMAYDSIAVRYRNKLIKLKFLTFGSFEELERVVKLLIKYQQSKEFSQKEGYILGFRKNGSRITAARPPFGETFAAWLRNFHVEDVTFPALARGLNREKQSEWVKGHELVEKRAELFMKGGATTAITGMPGVGKNTCLNSLVGYTYSWYSIRAIESEFEANFRGRFPGRHIYTMQETEFISESDAYNFSLRTSGDVTLITETRTDKMVVQIMNSANRGSKFTVFTYHPNSADKTPIQLAHALLRMKIYTGVNEALSDVLNTLKCCLHITTDNSSSAGDRYYSIYEFRKRYFDLSNAFESLKGQDRLDSFMTTIYNYYEKIMRENELNYDTVPIVDYDPIRQQYVVRDTITDSLYNSLYAGMQYDSDRVELMKVFRPEIFINEKLQLSRMDLTLGNVDELIAANAMESFDNAGVYEKVKLLRRG